jgi:putative nucleotidyltransferase with HDIG domain
MIDLADKRQAAISEVTLTTTLKALTLPIEEVLQECLPAFVMVLGADGAVVGLAHAGEFTPLYAWPADVWQGGGEAFLRTLAPEAFNRLARGEVVGFNRQAKGDEAYLGDPPFETLKVVGLRGEGGMSGLLGVGFARSEHEPKALNAALSLYAQALSAALERKEQQARLKRFKARLAQQTRFKQALFEVVADALRFGVNEAFYQRLLERSVAVIPGAQAGSIFIKDGGEFRVHAAVGYDLRALKQVRLSRREMEVSADMRHFRSQLVRRVYEANQQQLNDRARRILEEAGRVREIAVSLSVPVASHDEPMAVMYFDNFDDEDAFDEEALRTAEIFASQLGLVLQRLESHARAERRASFQKKLLALAKSPFEGGVSAQFYQRVLEAATQVIPGAQAGSVLVAQQGHFTFQAAEGYGLASLRGLRVPKEQLFLFRAPGVHDDLARPRLVTRAQLKLDAPDAATRAVIEREPKTLDIKAALIVPVLVEGELKAVVNLENFASEDAFGNEALEYAEAFGRQLGVMLEREALHARAERRARFQQLLASMERLLLEFGSLDDFLPRLAASLLAERGLNLDALIVYRLQGDQRWAATPYARERALRASLRAHLRSSHAPDASRLPSELASAIRLDVVHEGRLWGAVVFAAVRPKAFDAEVEEVFAQVVRGLELGLDKQAAREKMQAQLDQMQAIVAANELLGSSDDLHYLAEQAVETVLARTGTTACSLWLYEADTEALTLLARRGAGAAQSKRLAWQVVRTGEEHVGTVRHEGRGETCYALPLRGQAGEPKGVLMATRGDAALFSAEERTFIAAIAHACTNALMRFDFLQRSAREAEAYRALAHFGAEIEEINDVGELIRLGLQSLRKQLRMDMATYHEVRNGYCYPMEIWGEYPKALLKVRSEKPKRVGEGLTGKVAESGEMIYVEDYRRWPGALPAYVEVGLATEVVIPVKRRGEVVKIISICCFNRVMPLSNEQLTVARNFVRRLEHALERADNLREVHATRESTLRALGLMLEHRDFETKGHTDRVMALALRFGRKLNLDVERLQSLRWGAYLHDIGKIAVPDHILLKPGKLTSDEFEVIKEHTIIGTAMCQDILFLPSETRQIVRSHHERWDGSGYPDGLAGHAIPLMARIFSLVDVYDALTSERPYKPAWTPQEAVAEIRAERGSQFDPELTDVFLAMLSTVERDEP